MARRGAAVHVVTTRRSYKGRVYETTLLRRTFREGGKVRTETVGNLSHLPAEAIELVRRSLRGERFLATAESFEVERSLPHGHVAAVLAMARSLELARLLDREPSPESARVLAMVVSQLLSPGSKLACTRALSQSTLAEELSLEDADADDHSAALDWWSERQQAIERRLARRHLAEGSHVLYDVPSSYFEGRTCPLLALGYSRDRRRGSLQIIYGLLCDAEGRPVAIEVFPGGFHDDKTLPAPIKERVDAGSLSGAAAIALAVGQVINRRKMKKHFELQIEDDRFDYQRKQEQIDEEAALDGFYVLRTNVPADDLAAAEVVRSYKQLAQA